MNNEPEYNLLMLSLPAHALLGFEYIDVLRGRFTIRITWRVDSNKGRMQSVRSDCIEMDILPSPYRWTRVLHKSL